MVASSKNAKTLVVQVPVYANRFDGIGGGGLEIIELSKKVSINFQDDPPRFSIHQQAFSLHAGKIGQEVLHGDQSKMGCFWAEQQEEHLRLPEARE